MADRASAAAGPPTATWRDLFHDGRAVYTTLVVLATAMHALQILVIAIIMPTVVSDIGGAAYYTWPAMTYTVGSIVGAASVGPVWATLGRRRGLVVGAFAFLLGTVACALAPGMGALIAARAFQGYAGGLIAGAAMALISGLFAPNLRTRVIAIYQGTWMVAQLCGPVVGGLFAEINWWRGSFWVVVPIIVGFACVAWLKVPEGRDAEAGRDSAFPFVRLALLGCGVVAMAMIGPISETALRIGLAIAALGLVWISLRLDHLATNRLFPSAAFSVRSPVGLTLWILLVGGVAHVAITVFLPLLLQRVHGVTPLFISFVSIVISAGWTVGTFSVTGWTGARERLALSISPPLSLIGLAGMTATAAVSEIGLFTASAFVFGLGFGMQNVHIIARTMAGAAVGEERITAAAVPVFRSLGTAFGAALAGVLSTLAGLGDATDPQAIGAALTFVYGLNLLPMIAVGAFTLLLLRGAAARVAAPEPISRHA